MKSYFWKILSLGLAGYQYQQASYPLNEEFVENTNSTWQPTEMPGAPGLHVGVDYLFIWIEAGLLNKQTTEVDVSAAFALLKQAADNHVALDAQLSYTWVCFHHREIKYFTLGFLAIMLF